MALFDGRMPEERVEEAAYKAAWDLVRPRDGLVLDEAVGELAWTRAFEAAVATVRKAKPPLLNDAVRLHANKGYRRALDGWYARVQERRDTRRNVIVEAAHDAAAAMFSLYESESEVRGNTDAVYEATVPQASWLNDGELAVDAEPFAQAVYQGVAEAADERVDALCAAAESEAQWAAAREHVRGGGAVSDGGVPGSGPQRSIEAQHAYEVAVEVAREAATKALATVGDRPVSDPGLAMDAAAAAVEAMPDDMLGPLDDEEQIDATVAGVEAAAAGGGPPDSDTTAVQPPRDKAVGTDARASRRGGAFYTAGKAAGRAASGVKPTAAAAADRARVERHRLALARRAKRAADGLLPEAMGQSLPQADSDRVFAAAREAVSYHNEQLGHPFTPEEASRIADLTATSIIGTWHAVGHLRKSGLADKASASARTTAARFLRGYGVPEGVTSYLIDEAFRLATPTWAGGAAGPGTAGSSGQRPPRQATYRGRPVANYYDVLQVSPKASSAVIDRAWRVLIAESHPDQGGDPERAILLNTAHEVLLNADTRAAYDRENGF